MNRRELVLLLAAAMTAARALRGQQKAMPVIGFLSGTSPSPFASYVAAFGQGLGQTGWVEGQNVAIEYRWAEGRKTGCPHWPLISPVARSTTRRQVGGLFYLADLGPQVIGTAATLRSIF